MSTFEKIIIPLIDDCIHAIDLTDAAGFIDSYTSDPDNPSGDKEFFLVYDDRKRNSYTEDRAKRFENSTRIKKKYVKYVDGIPYYVYSFWVTPEVKKFYNGILNLSTAQKAKVLQFYGIFDSITDMVMAHPIISVGVDHTIPLEDYRSDSYDEYEFTINKEGRQSVKTVPLFLYPGRRIQSRLDKIFKQQKNKKNNL